MSLWQLVAHHSLKSGGSQRSRNLSATVFASATARHSQSRCLLPFVPCSSWLPAFSRRLLPCSPSLAALSPSILSASLLFLCLPKGSGGSVPSPDASCCPPTPLAGTHRTWGAGIPPASPASSQPLCPQHLQLSSPRGSSSCSAFHPRHSPR